MLQIPYAYARHQASVTFIYDNQSFLHEHTWRRPFVLQPQDFFINETTPIMISKYSSMGFIGKQPLCTFTSLTTRRQTVRQKVMNIFLEEYIL